MKVFISTLSLLMIGLYSLAQTTTITGTWKTIDDETGEARSIVEIYEKNGKAYGKIIDILGDEPKEAKCTKCSPDDDRHNKPIIGLEIIREMKKEKDVWDNGKILDPNNGKVYSCKLWVENDKLQVRGYIGYSWMGRTQSWERIN